MRKGRGRRRATLQRERQLFRLGRLAQRRFRRIIGVLFPLVVAVEGDAMRRAERAEMRSESLPVALPDLMAARIGRAVARGEMRKLLLDEWEVALPRRRLKAERARTEVRRVHRGDRAN